jgi:hypothetical protein
MRVASSKASHPAGRSCATPIPGNQIADGNGPWVNACTWCGLTGAAADEPSLTEGQEVNDLEGGSRLSANALDGRTKPRTRINFGRRTNRIELLRASGAFAPRRRRVRANRLSRAAAHCRIPFRGRCQLGARAVGAATCRCRAFGLSDQVGVRLARPGSLARRRVRRWEPRLSGSVDDVGLLNAGASIRSSLPVTRVVGLVSNGGLRSPAEIATVGGVAIAPLGGSFESRWPLRTFV